MCATRLSTEEEQVKREITRRKFLQLTAYAATGALIASCSPPPPAPTPAPVNTPVPAGATPTRPPAATVAPVSQYKEAPTLAELVKGGKLPPVEQRLPKNPMVMVGYEGIGKHGGTW